MESEGSIVVRTSPSAASAEAPNRPADETSLGIPEIPVVCRAQFLTALRSKS